MTRRKKVKQKDKLILFLLFLISIVIGIKYLYTMPEFEREKPIIESEAHLFWNYKDSIQITFRDNIGLKSYKLILSDGKRSEIIGQGQLEGYPKKQTILVKYPAKSKVLDIKSKHFIMTVNITDNSVWHNTATKKIDINIDYKRPNVRVIANSRTINQGGSALVVFRAEDKNLDKVYVLANGHTFKVQPYKKEGYYATLLAWPFTDKNFDAKVVATDKAGNKKEVPIPFYHVNIRYKVSKIRATNKFIDGKIADLSLSNPKYAGITDRLQRLKAINETMRENNEALIHRLSKYISNKMIDHWKVKRFYPLKNRKKVGSYGDHRYYYYGNKNNIISESYHVGNDFASTKMADIVTSNSGKVVFANTNGIYGNMPMIDHGLGLYTLYGHCSQIMVEEGDEVYAKEVIAKTGVSGLALGDHLHFGILIQGIEVRPVEWTDQKWITVFIDNIFKKADRMIASE
ncbi:MAG: M23 family metallopeptidase [Sulfurovum sp.]|nr:M23 family metallopeptidase [Sulfurovum sp.]MCB4764161.1 M23 family metallopeptidase [Sulfurovum sp.]MCB4777065.1 M23 family metallopeptidase [Sulfurovum sp.]